MEGSVVNVKLCECGCGKPALISPVTRRGLGHVAGQPVRFIQGHHFRSGPRYKGGRLKGHDGYVRILMKGHPRANGKGYILEHVLIAEKALGRPIPVGVEVHHVNEIRDDNRPSNLVICENKGYHKLLHARMDGYRSTGNPDARKCCICHRYDVGLTRRGTTSIHLACKSQYDHALHKKKCQRLNSENQLGRTQ